MKLALFAELTQEHLTVVRSTLKLRKETWQWVAAPEQADLIICDSRSKVWQRIGVSDSPLQIIVGTADAQQTAGRMHLPAPFRALKLIKLLDTAVEQLSAGKASKALWPKQASKQTDKAQKKIEATQPKSGGIPWAKKNIQFKGKTNFSSLPVTAELAMWLEIMASQPVSYQSMKAALPMDAELIDTVLNSAAKNGVLIDEQGEAIPPIESKSLLDMLFKR
ncbi:hypothetical protein [Halioxenophilus aromaticivorans]|uniref:Uncharacterized protein n=1 Tax=Halioxenophilus aromaticivorans TaxID=1306992 RepID=A0AAV3U930_9ALTE